MRSGARRFGEYWGARPAGWPRRSPPMKSTRTFKGSWFVSTIVAVIIIGEVVAWELSSRYGLRAHPLTVAFLCAGLVAAITAVLYEDARIG